MQWCHLASAPVRISRLRLPENAAMFSLSVCLCTVCWKWWQILSITNRLLNHENSGHGKGNKNLFREKGVLTLSVQL